QKLQAATNIFVVCDFNRRFLATKYPSLYAGIAHKIHLHHLGIELSEYAFQPGRNASQRIVAVGRFCKPKGFDVLVRAFAHLRSRGSGAELVFVGGGPDLMLCQKLAESLGVAPHIRFLGWLSPAETKEEIAKATVLVHPSVMLGDAVPTVIKEAMCLGTPVVGSDIAGIPELLDQGNCGLLVTPGSPAGVEHALGSL